MRVVGRKSLHEFLAIQPFAGGALKCWLAEVQHAGWVDINCVFKAYPKAELSPQGDIVFLLSNEQLRLDTVANFAAQIVFIKAVRVVARSGVKNEVAA